VLHNNLMATDTSLHTAIPAAVPLAPSPPRYRTAADLLDHVGVPAERVRMTPPPGTATEADLISLAEKEGYVFELIDGVLVEKAMGLNESVVAVLVGTYINDYLESHNLGSVSGEGGPLRILPGQVRLPDVGFISRARRGRGKPPKVGPFAPNLAVEVLSEGNTVQEMERKLREYFEAGVELVWYIYPETRTAQICTSPKSFVEVDENGFLDGGNVLPGLKISLRELFARADGPAA
jgi:Uma2 family endonuclease